MAAANLEDNMSESEDSRPDNEDFLDELDEDDLENLVRIFLVTLIVRMMILRDLQWKVYLCYTIKVLLRLLPLMFVIQCWFPLSLNGIARQS